MLAFLLGILMSLAPGDATATVFAPNDGPQTYCIAVASDDDSDQPGTIKIITSSDDTFYVTDDAPAKVFVTTVATDDETDVPDKSYIGVRITSVPDPLAAHVGDQGVMIGNITVGGPAEQAGIKRYDIVVKYANQDITGVSDLTSAITAAGHDHPVEVVVIREGHPLTLSLEPAARPKEMRWIWKYDEPEDVFADDAINFRGRTLQKGPGGEWIIRDLGQLQDLPQSLDNLEDLFDQLDIDLDVDINLDDDHPLGPYDQHKTYSFFGGNPPSGSNYQMFSQPMKGECKVVIETNPDNNQRELSITIERIEDDATTSITYKGDEYQVTRNDADGQETTRTYKTLIELEDGDPDAAQLLEQHQMTFVPKSESMVFVQPFGLEARKLRKEYQSQVEQKLRKALEDANRGHARAQKHAKKAYGRALDAQRRAEKEAQRHAEQHAQQQREHQRKMEIHRKTTGEPQPAGQQLVGVRVDADGQVTVYLRMDDGGIARLKFNSAADFQAAEPKLYKQAQPMFD